VPTTHDGNGHFVDEIVLLFSISPSSSSAGQSIICAACKPRDDDVENFEVRHSSRTTATVGQMGHKWRQLLMLISDIYFCLFCGPFNGLSNSRFLNSIIWPHFGPNFLIFCVYIYTTDRNISAPELNKTSKNLFKLFIFRK
jgi:hypothetical protein